MKYLICSDIHGSAGACAHIKNVFESSSFDYLILLGDILYHGPRNPLPESHEPKKVVEILNSIACKIIACRGNCDCEVDQFLLQFPIMQDYSFITDNGTKIFATHGHIYNAQTLPFLQGIDILLYGHTHIQELRKGNNLTICNPGSISLPKNSSKAGYATYCDKILTLFDMNDKEICNNTTLL